MIADNRPLSHLGYPLFSYPLRDGGTEELREINVATARYPVKPDAIMTQPRVESHFKLEGEGHGWLIARQGNDDEITYVFTPDYGLLNEAELTWLRRQEGTSADGQDTIGILRRERKEHLSKVEAFDPQLFGIETLEGETIQYRYDAATGIGVKTSIPLDIGSPIKEEFRRQGEFLSDSFSLVLTRARGNLPEIVAAKSDSYRYSPQEIDELNRAETAGRPVVTALPRIPHLQYGEY